MLIKLLKHDMLTSVKKRLLLLGISIFSAVLCCVFGGISLAEGAGSLLSEAICSLSTLAVSVATILMSVSVYVGFYTGLYSDAGQMAFTRPVSRGMTLLSKTLSGAIWLSVSTLASYGAFAVYISASSYSEELIGELLGAELYGAIANNSAAFIPLLLFFGVTATLMELCAAQLAISFGALIPKRARVICGIGIYVATTTAANILISAISSPVLLLLGEIGDGGIAIPESAQSTYAMAVLLINLAVNLVIIITAYLLTRLIINKKLSFK